MKRAGSWREYLAKYGNRCVEVDALPPDEIRARVKDAIESHIDAMAWERLQETERLERETFQKIATKLAA